MRANPRETILDVYSLPESDASSGVTALDASPEQIAAKPAKRSTRQGWLNNPEPDWLDVYRLMLLSRGIDLLEIDQLTPQGKVKLQFSAAGHELAQVLLAMALDHPRDAASVYYRSRPFVLASGLSAQEALAATMALSGSPSEGRDVGVVFNLPRRSGPTVLPTSGNVGAQFPVAVGWAQTIDYRLRILAEEEWRGAIAVGVGGDGSVAANGFWSALNIATTQNLPMLFFIEDNGYSISVPANFQTPGGNIAANLASYGNLKVLEGDGCDAVSAWSRISEAVRHVRTGRGPCLLRIRLPRLMGHAINDDQTYKSAALRDSEAARDPLALLREYLGSRHIPSAELEKVEELVREELLNALSAAEAAPEPDPTFAARNVFFEGVLAVQGGLRSEGALPSLGDPSPSPSGPQINMMDAIRMTLEAEMELNARVVVFGEDVGIKGGVHGVTRGMQRRFGPGRIFDTSLSEDGIIGRAVGMALGGLLPVPEIQFRKYADPAHEQITDTGTVRWRTDGKFAAPMVVRIPVGYGKRCGDPWHSVNGESIYAHTIGWRIAFPSNGQDAAGLLRTALRGDDPVLFLEHRVLLDAGRARRPYPGDDFCLPFGVAAELVAGNEVVVVTWGEMVYRCLEAAEAFAGRVAVLDLRTISPWDKETVLAAVREKGKCLIVHEDTLTAGFAGEIVASIASEAFPFLDAPVERLATPDCPIPYNVRMMDSVIPSVEKIRAKLQALLAY